MNDHHAQFLIAVADLCVAAELAALEVELTTADGTRTRGIPALMQPLSADDQVDDTGCSRTLLIDHAAVDLCSVVFCSLHSPNEA